MITLLSELAGGARVSSRSEVSASRIQMTSFSDAEFPVDDEILNVDASVEFEFPAEFDDPVEFKHC